MSLSTGEQEHFTSPFTALSGSKDQMFRKLFVVVSTLVESEVRTVRKVKCKRVCLNEMVSIIKIDRT